MKKLISKFLILLVCVALTSSCSCDKDNNLITYKSYYEQDVTTFNYMISNEYQDVISFANLVDGLVENDIYGNIVPSIANSWKSEIINDKQVWTFYLKDNVYWSDYNGNKYDIVTAHDFVTSLKYSLTYNMKSNNYSLAANLIENGLNYYNATLLSNYNYNEIISTINKLKISDPNNELTRYESIKNIFDSCNESNLCKDDFSTVGITAINDFELQFVLSYPVPYFLSALTYCNFLPVSEKFIKEIGFNNFGTSRKTLLYNGAYILSNYSHSSRIEYIKNPNYWDRENVFIDKLIFHKYLGYRAANFTRLAYESGNIDEFSVNQNDEKGWNKYVVGEKGLGTIDNPIGNNTYVSSESTDFTVYYLLFNQNRVNYNYSTLSQEEVLLANKALNNTNFRKALSYGIDRTLYFTNNDSNDLLSTIVPKGFSYNNDKDYFEYIIEEYSKKNNITFAESTALFNNDIYYNLNDSANYLDLAIKELNITSEQLPIKIEYTYYHNDEFSIYDKNRIENWNKVLNGCDINSIECSYEKVMIVYNDEINSINDYNIALERKEFHLTFLGIYPDYNDPTTYLKSFGSSGELYSYLNHSFGEGIDNMLSEIDKYYTDSSLDTRYKLCSELEYYIGFEKNLILPLSINSYNKHVFVSNLVPFSKMKASYGLSPFKFKYRKIRTLDYTQEDIKKLKEEYDKGKSIK